MYFAVLLKNKIFCAASELCKVNSFVPSTCVVFAGGTKEASVLVHLGHIGGVACSGPPRSADSMESNSRGIFSHRG